MWYYKRISDGFLFQGDAEPAKPEKFIKLTQAQYEEEVKKIMEEQGGVE